MTIRSSSFNLRDPVLISILFVGGEREIYERTYRSQSSQKCARVYQRKYPFCVVIILAICDRRYFFDDERYAYRALCRNCFASSSLICFANSFPTVESLFWSGRRALYHKAYIISY